MKGTKCVCDAAMTHDSLNPVTIGDEVQLIDETEFDRQFAVMTWMLMMTTVVMVLSSEERC